MAVLFFNVTDVDVADVFVNGANFADEIEKCEAFITVIFKFNVSLRSRLPSFPLMTIISLFSSSFTVY